ncbi:MAG TPA: hypothetical protein VM639_01510 [Dongiaceae bacterium]|nr:hypothetical protein [Dongiaceae bacterium]
MLPDDLPDNVIPLRPRRSSDADKSRRTDRDLTPPSPAVTRDPAAMPDPAKPPQAAKLRSQKSAKLYPISDRMRPQAIPPSGSPSLAPSGPQKPTHPAPSSHVSLAHVASTHVSAARNNEASEALSSANARFEKARAAAARAAQSQGPGPSTPDQRQPAQQQAEQRAPAPLPDQAHILSGAGTPTVTAVTLQNAMAPSPALSAELSAAASTKTEPAMPAMKMQSPTKPSITPVPWRRIGLTLAASCLLGIAIAWIAIAIGAHVVGLWPHGFAFYAMLAGGGVTMLLTAALMTAVFYSDSSGHDDEVQQFRPGMQQPADKEAGDDRAEGDGRAGP